MSGFPTNYISLNLNWPIPIASIGIDNQISTITFQVLNQFNESSSKISYQYCGIAIQKCK